MSKEKPVRRRVDLSKAERLDLVVTAHARYTMGREEIDRIIEEVEKSGHQPTISRILQHERVVLADNLAGSIDNEDEGIKIRGRVRVKVEVE